MHGLAFRASPPFWQNQPGITCLCRLALPLQEHRGKAPRATRARTYPRHTRRASSPIPATLQKYPCLTPTRRHTPSLTALPQRTEPTLRPETRATSRSRALYPLPLAHSPPSGHKYADLKIDLRSSRGGGSHIRVFLGSPRGLFHHCSEQPVISDFVHFFEFFCFFVFLRK